LNVVRDSDNIYRLSPNGAKLHIVLKINELLGTRTHLISAILFLVLMLWK